MLIREGDTRTASIDILLAATLTLVAGAVNSAGFLAYGYFSANMTGNVSMLSDMLSVWHTNAALAFLVIIAMFILGAFIASLFIQAGKRRQLRNVYALTLAAEASLLLLIGVALGMRMFASSGILVVGLLSLAMGLQNAASTRISGSRVRTTHVSGIATDIGIGLAILAGADPAAGRPEIVQRLWLHLVTIVSFALGGILGVLGFQALGGGVFCLMALFLFGLSARYMA